MSNEIQSISQSNYILHNIDAKKLYVQEPLFTANSGDAVYVGWRPDETVLWSGNDINATVSEPLSSFETIKIYSQWNYNGSFIAVANTEIPGTANSFNLSTMAPSVTTGQSTGAEVFSLASIYSIQNLTVSAINKSRININLPNMTCSLYSNTDVLKLQKIVGINRKENA